MAESNFVDYVKIQCRSGKGWQGLHAPAPRKVPA